MAVRRSPGTPLLAAGLLLGLVLLGLLAPGTARPAAARSSRSIAAVRIDFLAALNQIRVQHGLAPLRLSRQLDAAASAHSGEMLDDGYFGHDSFDGDPYWLRIKSFYPVVSGRSWAVGENLMWIPGTIDANQAARFWMASAEHRSNILSPLWRQIGISVREDASAPGVFTEQSVTVLTTDFGVRTRHVKH